MSYRKTHDLAVKVGEYEKNGETKGRYENVGQILSDGDNKLLLLKRTFNPAGVPNPDDKDSVILSVFAVREQEERKPTPRPEADGAPYSDDIPF
jgi:hypothetical protein